MVWMLYACRVTIGWAFRWTAEGPAWPVSDVKTTRWASDSTGGKNFGHLDRYR